MSVTQSLAEAKQGAITYEDYLLEGETHGHFDVLDGVRVYRYETMTSPVRRHQRLSKNIVLVLTRFEREGGGGEVLYAPLDILVQKDPLRVRQPDVMFYGIERLAALNAGPKVGPAQVAPDVVFEILSPSDTTVSEQLRIADYCKIGVLEYWSIVPEAGRIDLFRLTESGAKLAGSYGLGETVASEAIDGLSMTIDEIFTGVD